MMSNSNSKPEKNGALIDFLSNVLTGNFKKLVLINLLLDIPLVIIAGIIALISYLLGPADGNKREVMLSFLSINYKLLITNSGRQMTETPCHP